MTCIHDSKKSPLETKPFGGDSGLSPMAIEPLAPSMLNPLNLPYVTPAPTPAAKLYESKAPAKRPSALPPPLRLSANTTLTSLLPTQTAQLPCFVLPQLRNPNFVGRRNILEKIDAHLLRPSVRDAGDSGYDKDNAESPYLFALCGMGGIGKTDLAVEYAHSRRASFDAVFWLEAGGKSQLASDFGLIATQLGLQTEEESDSLESNIEIAKAWLVGPPKGRRPLVNRRQEQKGPRWMLIFDNADNLDIISPYVPSSGNGVMLVTSRDPFAKDHFFYGAGVDIEPLADDDAATLLRRLVTNASNTEDGLSSDEDEQNASVELAAYFGSLPLAMTQMAGVIRRRSLSIREFVDVYANDSRYNEIHNVSNPMQNRRYGNTLATFYNFQGLSSKAVALLRLLSFMNSDRIQEDIFVQPLQLQRHSTNTATTLTSAMSSVTTAAAASAHSLRWTKSSFERTRSEILGSSIVKRNIFKRELWIHRIIQAEVRATMDEEGRYQAFRDAVSLLTEIWLPGDHSSQKITRWALCERLLPHLERLYQLYIEYEEAWKVFEVDPAFPILMNEAAT